MPLLRLETTSALPSDKQKGLLPALSKVVAETIGRITLTKVIMVRRM